MSPGASPMNVRRDKTVDASTSVAPSGAMALRALAYVSMNAFRRLVRRNDVAVRIEMHLGAARDVHLRIDGRDFSIETIHTESHLKYPAREFARRCRRSA
jgi:hypothetical protein